MQMGTEKMKSGDKEIRKNIPRPKRDEWPLQLDVQATVSKVAQDCFRDLAVVVGWALQIPLCGSVGLNFGADTQEMRQCFICYGKTDHFFLGSTRRMAGFNLASHWSG